MCRFVENQIHVSEGCDCYQWAVCVTAAWQRSQSSEAAFYGSSSLNYCWRHAKVSPCPGIFVLFKFDIYVLFQYSVASRAIPWQALRVPGGWGSQIPRQLAYEGDNVSPMHRPPLLYPPPPRKYSWYSFLLEAESTPRVIVRPEGLCQWKTLMTPSGIEPATFRLVTQWILCWENSVFVQIWLK